MFSSMVCLCHTRKLPYTHPHPIWVPALHVLQKSWKWHIFPHWDPAIWCRHAGIRGGAWDQGDLSMAFESDKSCSLWILWRSSPSPEATSDTLLWTAPLDQCPERSFFRDPFGANSRHSMASLFWIDLKNWKVQWRCNLFLLTFVLKWSLGHKNHQSNLCTWYTFVWITEIPWLSLVWALALRVAPPVAEAAAPNLSSPSANGSHRRSLFIFGLGSIEIHEFFAHQAFPSVIFVQLVYDLAKTWTWHSGGCKKKRQRRSGHRVNSTCANSHRMVWCCVNLKWLSSRVHRFRYRHSVFWRDVTGRSSEILSLFNNVFLKIDPVG